MANAFSAGFDGSGMLAGAIARELGRAPSTVSRELSRGTVRRKSGYRASVAQALADQRAQRPKGRMLALDDRLHEHAENRLHAKDSPEQISRWLASLPQRPSMRVSYETIFRIDRVGHGRIGRDPTIDTRFGPSTAMSGRQSPPKANVTARSQIILAESCTPAGLRYLLSAADIPVRGR
jgi:IS30 family transposase